MIKSVIHQLLTPDHFQLEVVQIGNGSKVILAFHGFGRNGNDWKQIHDGWGDDYTIYAMNLYFHHGSKFPNERQSINAITKSEFQAHISFLLSQFKVDKVSVAGYSLGGKIALTFTELFSDRVKSVWLFAPDGVRINPWYQLASNTRIGRRTYARFLDNPSLFFKTVEFAKQSRIIDSKIEKFALENMDSYEKRLQVKDVWLALRFLNPDLKILRKLIVDNEIQVFQFYGKYDAIIPSESGKRFGKSIQQEENVFIIKCGHWLFRDVTIQQMKQVQTRKGC
jgi:pimeloyl-ACP methyl ester carboxylesterase